MRKIIITIVTFVLLIASAFFSIRFLIDYRKDDTTTNGSPSELIPLDLEKDEEYYTITYDLDGGYFFQINGDSTSNNPSRYNLFSETFTLHNPVKSNCDFIGWTGTKISEPKLNVTICKGSSGDLEFKANFEKRLDSPVISYTDNDGLYLHWDNVENATAYTININGVECGTTSNNFFKIEEKFLNVGSNIFKVKSSKNNGTIFSDYSNEITYNIKESLAPINLTYSSNVFKFNLVEDVWYYILTVGNSSAEFFYNSKSQIVCTDIPELSLQNGTYTLDMYSNDGTKVTILFESLFYSPENYSFINSKNHCVNVSVTAVAKQDSITARSVSNTIEYVYDLPVNFNKLTYSKDIYTHSDLEKNNQYYDKSLNANLVINIPSSFYSNTYYILNNMHPDYKIEVYKDNKLICTSFGTHYAGSYLHHFKFDNLKLAETYTLKLSMSSKTYPEQSIYYLVDINITSLNSDHLYYLNFKTV